MSSSFRSAPRTLHATPSFAAGYLITPTAAVWQGDSPTALERPLPPPPRYPILWARCPLRTKAGVCVALRRRGEEVYAGIGLPRPVWRPIDQVLTQKEQAQLVAGGFYARNR